MRNLLRRRSLAACLAVVVVGVLAGGCDWYQLGAESGLTGYNYDSITPANVSTLAEHFTASDGTAGAATPQAVVNGVLYASDANGVAAYSSNGTTGCSGSPSACAPEWSYPTGELGDNVNVDNSNIAVISGVLYASTSSGLEAFDAAGVNNCSGTPKVCQPLWTAAGTFGSPTVSNGTVYMTTSTGVEAFDANGSTNCSGTPKVCSPVWTASIGDTGTAVAVSGGTAYAEYAQANGSFGVVALDAGGTKDCSGSPKVCTPLRYYSTGTYSPNAYPIVMGSTLYVDTGGISHPAGFVGSLEAFDANGVTNCSGSAPTTCTPIWASPNGYTGSGGLIAGDDTVFQPPPIPFYFFSYASDGSDSTSPWRSSIVASPLAIGGSTLYATDGSEVYAFDATGSTGCSDSVCSPLWSAPGSDAIVANGSLYVSSTSASGSGEIVTYSLP